MISILKFTNGHNSVKKVDRVKVLIPSTSPNETLYLIKIT